MTELQENTPHEERYAAIQAELLSRWPESAISPSLSHMSSLMDLMGQPQGAYPVIQVTRKKNRTEET